MCVYVREDGCVWCLRCGCLCVWCDAWVLFVLCISVLRVVCVCDVMQGVNVFVVEKCAGIIFVFVRVHVRT